ncbi:hypothetical protein Pla108_23440 [Botrimarina colliarenosi]|uniref:Subtilase-type serine protease n=1 Tax=Botrimarina colliarenosi TaxID=2528001 RepID=A0A5C6AFI6_9BACT|nr:hypothetical protein [Botrimarina colliarenosi]TWT98187.1 hypothetical protein Pla108_23440 [Botrimarina colliarenosi]
MRLIVCFSFVLAGIAAPAAEPRLDQLVPQGVRRGAETAIKLVGPRLGADPQAIVFHEPGVSVTKLEAIDANTVAATLGVADDCPLGRHAVRLRTATGLSNLVTLHVGALESVDEAEPNNTLDQAQAIPTDRTVHGVIQAEDEDLFAVELAEGERLSVEVEAIRLGRTFFDPRVEVLDASGQLIVANDDQPAAYQDAFVSLVAKSAGKYVVRLRDAAFQGNNQSTYLLHVGRFPRPTAVYPPAAVAGEASEVTLVGGPTDGAKQSLTVAADGASPYELFATDAAGIAPSSLPLQVLATPPALEVEPNDSLKEPTPMLAPGAAAGVIQTADDRDHFLITAKKDQTLDLRVHARTLRSGLDPVLRVFDASGKRIEGNDDDGRWPDSYIRFKPHADGEYRLQVEDRLGRGDPSYTYVVEAKAPAAAAEVKLEERRRYEATTIEVPQGGRSAVLMTVTRRDFGGEVELLMNRLPPGVQAECTPLAGDYNLVPVVLTAEAEAPLAASLSPITVRRTATESPQTIETKFQQQNWLVRGRNNVSVWSHYTDRAPVAVTQRLPFSITVDQPKAPLCRNGSTNFKVRAERDEGFDQPIRVYTLHHTPGVSSNRSLSIPKGEAEAAIPVTANGNAKTGSWPMVVVAEANLAGRVYASSPFITLTVAEPYFDLAVPTLTTRQGEGVEMVVPLSHSTPFEGPATLELVGLPPGVTAEPVEALAGAESATFRIAVPADAKPGRHHGVGVRVRLPVEGERVEYRQGYSELRIDPAETKTAARPAAEGGRPS